MAFQSFNSASVIAFRIRFAYVRCAGLTSACGMDVSLSEGSSPRLLEGKLMRKKIVWWIYSRERYGCGHTPLCPAGHLPHKEGDRIVDSFRPSLILPMKRGSCRLSISPPVGEMPGRAEGGAPGKPNKYRQ